jgi:hypothetical protein
MLILNAAFFIQKCFFPTWIRVITKLPNSEQSYKGKVKTHKYINRQNQSTTGKLWKRNDPDLVQAFLKKWWVESDFIVPNLPLSLRLKVSGCHYNSIYNNTWTKQVKQLSKQHQTQWSKCQRHKWHYFYSVYYCYYLIMFVYAFVKPIVCMRLNNKIIIIINIMQSIYFLTNNLSIKRYDTNYFPICHL